MSLVTSLTCVVCGRAVDAPVSAGTCPQCNDPFAVLEVQYDMGAAGRTMTPDALQGRSLTHWRYRELLPVEITAGIECWPVGWTPVLEAPRLAEWVGVRRLRFKDEGRNITASFKDRASSVGVAHALAAGATRIACASTGNAASSCAGYAAMAGLPATIFVPQSAPDPKVTQLLIYGADVRRVRGNYGQAYDLCSQTCADEGWYNRNCAINPYLVEGKKTCGLEIAEQTAGDLPGHVVVSVGDGCTIAGIGRGMLQMQELGFTDRTPALLGVQAEGVAPIVYAFEHGELPDSTSGQTMADSIDVPIPRNWRKAVTSIRATGGSMTCVNNEEIGAAMRACGALAGLFAEPAAAASVAGIRRAIAEGRLGADADVLAVITGSGLKDIRGAMSVAGSPVEVDVPKN